MLIVLPLRGKHPAHLVQCLHLFLGEVVEPTLVTLWVCHGVSARCIEGVRKRRLGRRGTGERNGEREMRIGGGVL